jgi:hypothetical protein
LKNAIRISLVAACTALLAACGGGAKLQNKQEAANAAFAASQGTKSAQGSLLQLAQQNAGLNVDVTVSCPKSGKATISYQLDTTGGSGSGSAALQFKLTYDNCSYTGETAMSGAMNVVMGVEASGTSFAANISMKGKITFTGEVNDFVDVDVVQTVDASKLGTTDGGSVTIKLRGTITTSTQPYSYRDETITVTAGQITHS